MARPDRPAAKEPKRRGRFFWICLLVLLMIVVWMVLKPLIDTESTRTLLSIVAGVVFVIAFRDRIWGEDWREQLAAERKKQQAKRPPRRR